jgi:hypothetical protein
VWAGGWPGVTEEAVRAVKSIAPVTRFWVRVPPWTERTTRVSLSDETKPSMVSMAGTRLCFSTWSRLVTWPVQTALRLRGHSIQKRQRPVQSVGSGPAAAGSRRKVMSTMTSMTMLVSAPTEQWG